MIFLASVSAAVLSGTTIGYIYPAGGQAGKTIQVIVGGQALWPIRDIVVSGGGVKLLKLQNAPGTFYPGCWEQNQWVREYMRQVYSGKLNQPRRINKQFGVWRYSRFHEELDHLDPLMLSLACKGIFERPNSLQASPAIGQKLVLTLQIAPDAKPGAREFRLIGSSGNLRSTNPMRFYIGKVPEFREQNYQMPPLKRLPVTFTVPSVINGQIEPGEVDHFKFKLKKGETVNFQLKGRDLNPFIGDGVPGNFQPVLEIRDEKGRSLAFADDNYFDPDPVLEFTAPADALYTLEIRDALYRGREDFVYRIDAARGKYKRSAITAPAMDIPEICEHAAAGKKLRPPVMISGTIPAPGAEKIFTFQAVKGKKIVAEIFARRLGSPLDSILKIYDPDGREIAVNDDFERPNVGYNMQHVDSFICFTPAKDGVYTVKVADTAETGGRDHQFFLRIDRPRPGFQVYLVPSAPWISLDTGTDVFKVVVEKFDGFDREISLELKKAENITISGISSIPGGASESIIGFSSYWTRKLKPVYPELWAVSGKLRIPVKGADAAMQAFAYTHYVPAERIMMFRIWIHGNGDRFKFPPKFNFRVPLKRGGSFKVNVNYAPFKSHFKPAAEFTLPEAPEGVTLKTVKKGNTYQLIFTAAKNAPAVTANKAVRVKYTFDYKHRDGSIRKSVSNFHMPVLRISVR